MLVTVKWLLIVDLSAHVTALQEDFLSKHL